MLTHKNIGKLILHSGEPRTQPLILLVRDPEKFAVGRGHLLSVDQEQLAQMLVVVVEELHLVGELLIALFHDLERVVYFLGILLHTLELDVQLLGMLLHVLDLDVRLLVAGNQGCGNTRKLHPVS